MTILLLRCCSVLLLRT